MTKSSVRLISATPEAEFIISYCARVSNPDNQDNTDNEKLIRYCIKHKHFSILEMAHVVMEIQCPRSISQQLTRHRSFSFQEFSQRYADVGSMDYPEPPDLRRQDTKNRQNSIDDLDEEMVTFYQTKAQLLFDQSRKLYDEMVAVGVAKECARDVLPLATPTRLYMAGSVRSWLHYVDLRQSNGTQKEHQEIALKAKDILYEVVPTVAKAMWGDSNDDLWEQR